MGGDGVVAALTACDRGRRRRHPGRKRRRCRRRGSGRSRRGRRRSDHSRQEGHRRAGLGPADFKVEIAGKPREIVSVELVDYGRRRTVPAADAAPAELEISTNDPKDNGRVILLLVDQGSLRTESRTVINAAREWVMSLGPKDLVGPMTFPLPGPRLEFTKDHAKLADMLTRVTGLGTPPLPFNNRNISIWEAFRIEAGDSYIRGDVITRECRADVQLCPGEIDMQSKTMAMTPSPSSSR